MISTGGLLPILFVEGTNDISVISALLFRHGVDTEQGKRHLFIKNQKNIETLLLTMPDAIKAATDRPVGFVLDIDIEIANRWDAVCGRLRTIGISPPTQCPSIGYFGQLTDYPYRFGIWLMPDCTTDNLKLENLCQTLIPVSDVLWPHAQASVAEAKRLIDEANGSIADENNRLIRFRDVDLIKSEIHTWLAWQRNPGAPLGSAIIDRILNHDSPQAMAFLVWLKDLFGFH